MFRKKILVFYDWDAVDLSSSVEFLLIKPILKELVKRNYKIIINVFETEKNIKILTDFVGRDSIDFIFQDNKEKGQSRYPFVIAGSSVIGYYCDNFYKFDAVLTNNVCFLGALNSIGHRERLPVIFNLSFSYGYRAWEYEYFVKQIDNATIISVPSNACKNFVLKGVRDYLAPRKYLEFLDKIVEFKPYLFLDNIKKVEEKKHFTKRIGFLTPLRSMYGYQNMFDFLLKYYEGGNNFSVYLRIDKDINEYDGSVVTTKVSKKQYPFIEFFSFMPHKEFLNFLNTLDLVVIDINTPELNIVAMESLYSGIPVLFKRYDWIYELVPNDYPLTYSGMSEFYGIIKSFFNKEIDIDFTDIREKLKKFDVNLRSSQLVDKIDECSDKYLNSLASKIPTEYDDFYLGFGDEFKLDKVIKERSWRSIDERSYPYIDKSTIRAYYKSKGYALDEEDNFKKLI